MIDNDEEWNEIYRCGFLLRENSVTFRSHGGTTQGTYWIKILTADEIVVSEGMKQALTVPFHVPSDGRLYVLGDDERIPFYLGPGHYNILFERRYMTEEEVAKVTDYAEIYLPMESQDSCPELYQFTFLPSDGTSQPERIL